MILAAFPSLNDSVIPSTFLGCCTTKTSTQGRFSVLKTFTKAMAVGAELPSPSTPPPKPLLPRKAANPPPLLQSELPTLVRMDQRGIRCPQSRAACWHGYAIIILAAAVFSEPIALLPTDSSLKPGELFVIFFLAPQPRSVCGAGSARSRDALDVAPGAADCFPLQMKGVKSITAFFHYWSTDT